METLHGLPVAEPAATPDAQVRKDLTRDLLEEASRAPNPERIEILERVVLANRGVADAIARRYRARGIDEDDLRQVAYEGLVRAVARFDLSRSEDLLSYAVPVIRGGIQRYFRDHGWSVRPPRRVQDLQWRMSRAIEWLRADLGREPTRAELCEALEATADDVAAALSAYGSFTSTSLDRPLDDEGTHFFADVLAAPDNDSGACEARLVLSPVVGRLSERERRILYLRFFEERTQEEIGRDIGVTQMQVSRLISQILTRLRDRLESGTLPCS